jgi:NIMA (never in mitosis gene a)-related kinase
VWALGCILYELCTLKQAFSSQNLLGLVFKIVQGKQDPIPEEYSPQLRELCSMLLDKDETKRPPVIDILKMPYVQ